MEKVRDINLTFRPMSLAVLNESRDELPPDYKEFLARAWLPARAIVGVEQTYGSQKVRDLYNTIGTMIHNDGEEPIVDTVRTALNRCDLSESIADQAADGAWDTELRASHARAISQVGDDVGTPVITINGMSLFGPVLSPAPKGEQAGELFDGFVKITSYPGFFELKRSRDVGPIFN